MEFEVIGLDKFVKELDIAGKEIPMLMKVVLNKITQKTIKNVKLKTPVDTGQLRRSWQSKRISNLESLVYNSCEYSIYVEKGHRTRSGSVVDGRYMLGKTIEEVSSSLDEELEDIIKSIW